MWSEPGTLRSCVGGGWLPETPGNGRCARRGRGSGVGSLGGADLKAGRKEGWAEESPGAMPVRLIMSVEVQRSLSRSPGVLLSDSSWERSVGEPRC
jgi:hypothetical protein